MKLNPFTLEVSGHGMPITQADDLSDSQIHVVRRIITNNVRSSEDYKLRLPAGVSLQACYEGKQGDGWVLIEFWNRNAPAIQKFINHLNNQLRLGGNVNVIVSKCTFNKQLGSWYCSPQGAIYKFSSLEEARVFAEKKISKNLSVLIRPSYHENNGIGKQFRREWRSLDGGSFSEIRFSI